MNINPTQMADWEIADHFEKNMLKISEIGKKLRLTEDELLPFGHYMGKIDYQSVLERHKNTKNGKYITVTSITPTPLGEGKSTTTIGLLQGLGKRGKKVAAAIRQPSGGPTMGTKGSAAGGGLSQCIPLTQYSLGFTGDINAVTNAHNLAMTALTARMQHERNYDDETLLRLSKKSRLNIDPKRINIGFVIDFCCQSLRNIIIGLGGAKDGFTMESHFDISVASEIMGILAICNDLKDMRERMGKIIVAYDKYGKPVTTRDLQVDGAMTAWLVDAIKPNIIQSLEGQPVFVHAGPFANISVGQNSIIADKVSLKLNDYHITESGFGADIGYEKMWNLKCHYSKLAPDAVVIVATVRALKSHGGAPEFVAGRPMPEEYKHENIEYVEKGTQNLLHHINIVKQSGIKPVVCINAFVADTQAEIAKIKELCEKDGVRVAVSNHWAEGGNGALELADAVIDACEDKNSFTPLYQCDMPITDRIHTIAKNVYGARALE
ncbi:MAG: formate--tetrahydrofolate ligase, partial [Mailhella sp.]